MSDRWVIVIEPEDGEVPAAVRVRRLLKHAGRQLGLTCKAVRNPAELESLVMALAERVAKQAELLTKRSEKR